jgi:parallel beta-helix repeat protein
MLLVATMILTLLVASGVALATAIGSAQAANKVVGPAESIQKAVNAAHPGDTIVVRGVHREDVIIRKDGIKLRGEDAVIEAPTRAKADSPCSKFVGGPEAICVLGDFNPETDEINKRVSDVSVSGFTFRGFKDKDAFVIDVFAARNATVVGNRITGNVASGIAFGKSVNTTIANNHVIGSPETEHSIVVEASSRTKILNNVVRNNVFGIEAVGSTNTTIAGNDSIGNVADGFGVIDSPGTKVISNVARRNDTVGIFLGDTQRANAKVVGNDLSGSDFGIFVSNSQGGSFAANEVHNNCAGMVFTSDFEPAGPPSGNFAVKGNTVKDNTLSCAAPPPALSGLGIGLFGTRGMEVTGNHLSGNVPTGPSASSPSLVSGGVVVGVDPIEGGTTKPTNNSVIGNHFGRNKPDIFWDESGSGNSFVGNLCDTSVPSSLCN